MSTTNLKIYVKDKNTQNYLSHVGIQIYPIGDMLSESTEIGDIPYYHIEDIPVGDYELALHKLGYKNLHTYPISLIDIEQNIITIEMEQYG